MSTKTPNPVTDTKGDAAARKAKDFHNPIHSSLKNDPLGGAYVRYPDGFPTQEMMLLGESLINKEIDKARLGHAAWACAGYALSVSLGDPDEPPIPESAEETHKLICSFAKAGTMPSWLVPLILQVLQQVLTNL